MQETLESIQTVTLSCGHDAKIGTVPGRAFCKECEKWMATPQTEEAMPDGAVLDARRGHHLGSADRAQPVTYPDKSREIKQPAPSPPIELIVRGPMPTTVPTWTNAYPDLVLPFEVRQYTRPDGFVFRAIKTSKDGRDMFLSESTRPELFRAVIQLVESFEASLTQIKKLTELAPALVSDEQADASPRQEQHKRRRQ